MTVEPLISEQQAAIVWRRSDGPELLSRFVQAFDWPRAMAGATGTGDSDELTTQITALGTHEFLVRNEPMEIGDSGVTVQISDLYLAPGDRTVFAGGQKYVSPALTRMGAATVTGTTGKDVISVWQDADGNTILGIDDGGQTRTVDLGRIAALTLHGAGEDDTIAINVRNYFGGVTVYGGDGDDKVSVRADYSLGQGVTVSGGAGDDTLTVSGKALAVLLEGGAGSDRIDASLLEGESGLLRRLRGEAGNDAIYGSAGEDRVRGGGGHDYIGGGAGDDSLYGDAGEDVVYGGEGADLIYGGDDGDVLYGGEGDDEVSGESGDDILMGDGGGDYIRGGAGDDAIYGGSSEDEVSTTTRTGNVEGGGKLNALSGGAGSDTFAPSSTSPENIVAYTGTGNYLLDYDGDVDVLV